MDWHMGAIAPGRLVEIERHLDACGACRQVLNELTSRAAPPPTRASQGALLRRPGEAAALPPGAPIGRYVAIGVMGRGGMGIVYAAYDPVLDRKVALKLLHAEPVPSSAALLHDELRREAQAMARLSHPNVVGVFDVGMDSGQLFIAMELIEGTTLAAWLRGPKRSTAEVVRHLIAAGRGLEAAHEGGFVHRDFKPANVLIGHNGRVCVTDFGLAHLVTDPGPVSRALSGAGRALRSGAGTGPIVGTPVYMAPEQLRGARADERSDQFSFCVTLYEALYGERPFAGDCVEELARSVLSGKIRPPPRSVYVPARLRGILLRGLRVEREERYPSMAALLAELERDPGARLRRAALGAVGASLLLFAGVGMWRSEHQPSRTCNEGASRLAGVWDAETKKAIHAAFGNTGNPYADLEWRGVERSLDAFASAWVRTYNEACLATRVRREQSAELLDLRMDCLNRRLGETAALTALFAHADSHVVDGAVQAAQGSDDLSSCSDGRALHERRKPPTLPAERAAYDLLERKLETIAAMSKAGQLLDIANATPGAVEDARRLAHPVLLADALRYQSVVRRGAGALDEAQQSLHEAAVAALLGADDGRAARAWNALAIGAADVGRFDEAKQWLQYAAAAGARAGDDVSQSASHLIAVARVASATARFAEAAVSYRQSADLYQRLGQKFAEMKSLSWAGSALVASYQTEEGERLCAQALAWFEDNVGSNTLWAGAPLQCLGLAAETRGRPADALVFRRRVVALNDVVYGGKGSWSAYAYAELASSLVDVGQIQEALAMVDEAERISKEGQIIGEAVSSLGHVKARVLLELDRASEAAALLEPHLEQLRTQVHPSDLADTAFDLSRALWSVGKDRARSRRLAEEARGVASSLASVPQYRALADTIDAWLREHPAPALAPR